MPCTRARTSASLDPAVWPTYSNRIGTVAVLTSCTVTGAGGNPPFPPLSSPLARPQAVNTTAVVAIVMTRVSARIQPFQRSAISSGDFAVAMRLVMDMPRELEIFLQCRIIHTFVYVCISMKLQDYFE